MTRMIRLIPMLVLTIVSICAGARAEKIATVTLEQLLEADCIAVGHFEGSEEEGFKFVTEENVRGNPDIVGELFKDGKIRFQKRGDAYWYYCSSMCNVEVITPGGGGEAEIASNYIWFFRESHPFAEIQSVELLGGYRELLAGREPDELFKLIQGIDYDMRRAALEKLYAAPDAEFIEKLHKVGDEYTSQCACSAVGALVKTGHFDWSRYWDGKWRNHNGEYYIVQFLKDSDRGRFRKEVMSAIDESAAGDGYRVPYLMGHLGSYGREVYVPVGIRFLNYSDARVRRYAVGVLDNALVDVGYLAGDDPEAKEELGELTVRIVGLLETRLEKEEDKDVVKRIEGVLEKVKTGRYFPFVPPDAQEYFYSDEEERELMLRELLYHGHRGFVFESTIREMAEHEYEFLIKALKEDPGSQGFRYRSRAIVALGYIRDEKAFAFLSNFVDTNRRGNGNFKRAFLAIARQNNEKSLDTVLRTFETKIKTPGNFWLYSWLFEALTLIENPRGLGELRKLKEMGSLRTCENHYRLALAAHGDEDAVADTVKRMSEMEEGRRPSDEDLNVLARIDRDDVTDALKACALMNWPEKTREPSGHIWLYKANLMQNYSGAHARTTVVGEVARRDPQWLAALALEKMASEWTASRQYGIAIFAGLTGRTFGYDPEAFAGDRKKPLEELRTWWKENSTKSREEWLKSYFADRGCIMKDLYSKDSLALLADMLDDEDGLTHGLAVETISVITGKYFYRFRFYAPDDVKFYKRERDRQAVRIRGWLESRGYFD